MRKSDLLAEMYAPYILCPQSCEMTDKIDDLEPMKVFQNTCKLVREMGL